MAQGSRGGFRRSFLGLFAQSLRLACHGAATRGMNQDRDGRKDEAGALVAIGTRLHPFDSTVPSEFAYSWRMRTDVT